MRRLLAFAALVMVTGVGCASARSQPTNARENRGPYYEQNKRETELFSWCDFHNTLRYSPEDDDWNRLPTGNRQTEAEAERFSDECLTNERWIASRERKGE